MGRDYPNVETIRLSDDEKVMLTVLSKRSGLSRAEVMRKLLNLAWEVTDKHLSVSEILRMTEDLMGSIGATNPSVAPT